MNSPIPFPIEALNNFPVDIFGREYLQEYLRENIVATWKYCRIDKCKYNFNYKECHECKFLPKTLLTPIGMIQTGVRAVIYKEEEETVEEVMEIEFEFCKQLEEKTEIDQIVLPIVEVDLYERNGLTDDELRDYLDLEL